MVGSIDSYESKMMMVNQFEDKYPNIINTPFSLVFSPRGNLVAQAGRPIQ